MSVHQRLFLATLVSAFVFAPAVRAEKLSKGNKKWLKQVGAIILQEEEQIYKGIQKKDRDEFEKIFWARRDPDLKSLDQNEFREGFEKAVKQADDRFKIHGRAGSETDCGRVFILMGEPNNVERRTDWSPDLGRRQPETWTYLDNEQLTFDGGQLNLTFDDQCQLPAGSRFNKQLDLLAQGRVLHPHLVYTRDAKDRLIELKDLLPKPSAVRTLLAAPREDFAVKAENAMVLRQPNGAAYVAGMIKGVATDMVETKDVDGAAAVELLVAAQATDPEGLLVEGPERMVLAKLDENGSFTVSYGLPLRSGSYTLTVGAVEPKSGKGAAVAMPVETPAFASGELVTAPLLMVDSIQELPPGHTPDPRAPMASFMVGSLALGPRFGNVFEKSDAITFFGLIYGAKVDEATGKASLKVSFQLAYDDGTVRAKAPDQPYETADAFHSVGPVPLAKFDPGTYTAHMKVVDEVAEKEYVEEGTFVIAGPAETEPAAEQPQ